MLASIAASLSGFWWRDIALENIQEAMYAVEVDKPAARRAEEKLRVILDPNPWHGRTVVRKEHGIMNVNAYIADLRESLDMPEEQYKEILFMSKQMQAGQTSQLEVDFDNGKMETNYLFFTMYKRRWGKTDMIYAQYKLTAEAPPKKRNVKIGEKTSGWLWWKTVESIYEERMEPSGLEQFRQENDSKAFFRYKALEAFADVDLIDLNKLDIIN